MLRKVILKTWLSPGDLCVLTAAIESLHASYPGEYLTDVRSPCDDLFANNPHITRLDDAAVELVELHYTDLISCCDGVSNPFLRSYCHDLGKRLGISLELTTNRPHLYLTEEEMASSPLVDPETGEPMKYWVISAGIKRDFTLKQWPVEYYQEVVDQFRGKVQLVQIGSAEHDHPALDGVINLVGQTDIRQLMRLVYHAQGGVGPITFLQHLCAAGW